ncbi:MAG: insulinase family protein, partial [Verrucomicrobiota bacterium]
RRLDVPTDKTQAVLMVGFEGASVTSEDRLALELLEEACNDMASRFFLRIREEMGLAYYVGCSQMLGYSGGVFGFYLGTSIAQLDAVEEAMLEEIAGLGEKGPTPEEVKRAQKTYLGKNQISRQSPGAMAGVEALDELFGLGYRSQDELAARVEAHSVEKLTEVAGRYLKGRPPVIVRMVPGQE